MVFCLLDSQTAHISLCLIQSDTRIPFQVWLKIIGHPPQKKNLHLSNQYKILVPTKILMRFFGMQISKRPHGWWVFHRIFCCQASEFGTFWFRTAPHDRFDASGHAGLGVPDSKLHGNQWRGVRCFRNLRHFLQEPLYGKPVRERLVCLDGFNIPIFVDLHAWLWRWSA